MLANCPYDFFNSAFDTLIVIGNFYYNSYYICIFLIS